MALKETLEKLISFRTVTGHNDEIARSYEWVKEELRGLPLFIQEYNFEGVPSLVITTREGQKNPKVWLAAHMDVVPGSESVWTPREENGQLIGRGAFDMKFAAACYIELFKELGDKLSNYDIGILFSGDEEVGGFNSIKKLIGQEGLRGEVVFLPDGGGAWEFEESAKGLWTFEIIAAGTAVHSSRPWLGKSAIETMSQLLGELYPLAQEYWLDTSDHWHLTCNVGMMSGGTMWNQTAHEARVTVDVRATSTDEQQEFESRIRGIIAKYPNVTTRDMWNEAPYGISKDFLLSRSFARIAKEHHDIECGWTKSHGSTDARHFAQYGVPVLLIWPNAGGHHSEKEWIDLADLQRFYNVMKSWVKEVGHDDAISLPKTNSAVYSNA